MEKKKTKQNKTPLLPMSSIRGHCENELFDLRKVLDEAREHQHHAHAVAAQ
jgi:hypothetical protein